MISTFAETLPKELEVTEDVLNEKSNSGEPPQPQPQLSPAIPKMTSQVRPSAVHNMTATTSEVATAPKRKRPSSSICIRDKIDEMHLQVLKKESNKLDLEIENLLLQREKLQREIEHIKSRIHHEQ